MPVEKTRHTTLSPIPMDHIPALVRYCHKNGLKCFTLGGTIRDVLRDVALDNMEPLDRDSESTVQKYVEIILERYRAGKVGV